jgi:hypothetical protein
VAKLVWSLVGSLVAGLLSLGWLVVASEPDDSSDSLLGNE